MRIDKTKKIELCCQKPNGMQPLLAQPFYKDGTIRATDGHMLAVVHTQDHENDETGPVSISMLKETRRQREGLTLSKELQTSTSGATMPREKNFVDFPDTDNVTPNRKDAQFSIALDAKLLFKIAQAIGCSDAPITLHFNGPTGGILIESNNNTNDDYGVLMPCRMHRRAS